MYVLALPDRRLSRGIPFRSQSKSPAADRSLLTKQGPIVVDLKIDPGPVKKRNDKPLRVQPLRDAFKAALNGA